ncbi:MAG: hypothetical protein R3D29_09590 [Nitratireductor sp.]
MPEGKLTREALRQALAEFAMSWLGVITGELSVALNSRSRRSCRQRQEPAWRDRVLHNGPLPWRGDCHRCLRRASTPAR